MDNRNLIFSIMLILTISNVFALGINSPYWKDNPLKMYPGETRNIQFTLENSISEEKSAEAIVSLIDSSGISEIIGKTEFTIPPGSKDQKVELRVSIPDNAEIGKTYNIKFSIKPSNTQQEGNIQAVIGYDVEFPVIVTEKSQIPIEPISTTKKESKVYILIPILVVLIIAIGALYYIYRKKSNLNNI